MIASPEVAEQIQLLETIRLVLPTIEGWCTFEKAKLLVEKIIQAKPKVLVEIGVFGGSSLIPQALALKLNNQGMIHGIDPWTKDAALEGMIAPEHKDWWAKVDLDVIYEHCLMQIHNNGVESFVNLHRAKASDVVDQFADGGIDILHIDGNHSEEPAYQDAKLYLPKVKSGGFIFFDDIYWAEAPSAGEAPKQTTRKAILLLLQSCERIGLVNDCMLLQKK